MSTKKFAPQAGSTSLPPTSLEEEDEGQRTKISITVANETLERLDAYRRRRGGLSRSAVFALAADWFMDANPVTKN